MPKRVWKDAIEKIEREIRTGKGCRACGATDFVDAAHVIGREWDSKKIGPRGGKYIYVRPDSVIPLCGAFSKNFCHQEYDQHRLNIYEYLTYNEWRDAVSCVGEGRAMRRTAPLSTNRKES